MKSAFAEKVYRITKQIPRSRVATYGQIARLMGKPKAARAVGNALHCHHDPNVPCHRVVNREGKLALNFGDRGWQGQRGRLLREGIKFKTEKQVDLKKHRAILK